MALSKAQIDLDYLEVLARHATAAEQDAFSALSNSVSVEQIHLDIATLPEATSFVDPVVRLYQGAFNRVPDSTDPNGNFDTGAQSGFWVNVNALRAGIGLQALANAFVASAEFLGIYGTTAVTPALITAYYHNILQRDPSSAEVAAWQATGLNAAQILIGFTQSAEFIAKSQASVNQFKLDLADGLHPSGPLLGPPGPTFTVEASAAAVDEGSPVTFTIQGQTTDAGKDFSYTISGVSAADVVGGQLSGTVTLDSNGTAFLTVNLANDLNTEGSEQLTLSVNGIDTLVTVNDTSTNPLIFTSTVGETLNGTSGNDTFTGVVDRTFANDSSTFSNVVDIANGKGGTDTLKLVVNQSNIDIVPNAPGVERLLVTDLSGEDYNLANMKDITTILSDGSDGDMDFFNVQNIVDLSVSNSDNGGDDIEVTVIDAAGTGDVDVTLNNSGAFDLDYHNTSGKSVVENYTIHSFGNNHLDNLHGAEILQTVTIDGNGTFHLDFTNGEDTRSVTDVDAREFDGNFLLHNLDGGPSLTIFGANGNNDLEVDEIDNGSQVKITTQGGFDLIRLDTDGNDGASVTVDTKDGGATINMLESADSDGTTVDFKFGTGTNKADIDIGANSSVTINSVGVIEVDLDAFNLSDAATTGALTAEITSGTGSDNIRVDSAADGFDNGSNIKINAGAGNNVISTNSLNAAVVSIIALGGNDNITATIEDGAGSVTVDAGDGDNTVLVNADDGATVKVTTGSGKDSVTVNGSTGGGSDIAAITIDTGAEADSIVANWFNPTNPVVKINAGTGDDRVELNASPFGDTDLTANAILDGGDGVDILALGNDSVTTADIDGKALNFEILEVTTRLTNNINMIDFVAAGSNINHVILDAGIDNDLIISGFDPNPTIEIKAAASSTNDDLTVLLNNALINVADKLNVVLNADQAGFVEFGGLSFPFVETLHITSTSQQAVKAGIENNLELNTNFTTLNLDGDVTLDLNDLAVAVQTVNAATFTGGLFLDDDFTAGNITINAPLAGDSNIRAFQVGTDNVTVTLGNGNNTVVTAFGDDIINVGTGANVIHSGGGLDNINLGFGGAGSSTLVFDAASESDYSLPDVVTGFNTATDVINLFNISTVNDNSGFHFAQVSSDAVVAATIAGLDNGDTHINIVFNTSTGHLFIDANSNGTMDLGADAEINLVGVTNLLAGNISLSNPGVP